MSRRGIRGQDASVSLFPFLAVLICTMGALIVLLVVVVQQARTQAEVAATQEETSRADDVNHAAITPPSPSSDEKAAEVARRNNEREDLIWQVQLLTESRETTRQRVQEARLTLSHLEQHAGELEQTLEKLRHEADLIMGDHNASTGQAQEIDQQIQELNQEVAAQEAKFEELQAASGSGPVYAIVPYQGPQGTNRRPIYIECLADRVLLQPEGIEFVSDDFNNSDDPSNALAAAIRAAREYFVSSDPRGQKGDAYPLLIVRPSGSKSYIASRAAMQSWDDEFGYELVTADMQLTYPPADPTLAKVLAVTVDHARNQRIMMEQWEEHAKPELAFEASSRGGFAATGPGASGSGLGGSTAGFGSGCHRPSNGFGGEAISNGNGNENGEGEGSGNGEGNGKGNGKGNSGGGGPIAAVDGRSLEGSGQVGGAGGLDPSSGEQGFDSSMSGSDAGRFARDSGYASAPADDAGGDFVGGGANGAGGQGSRSGGEDHGAGGEGSGAGQSSAGSSSATAAGGAGGSGQQTASNGGSSGAGGNPQQGVQATIGSGGGGHEPAALAQQRGNNWALPNAAGGSIAITRPLKIVFEPEGVRLPPESGTRQQTRFVRWSDSVEETVDPVVEIVWQRIENWGIAGLGVYWQPILEAEADKAMSERVEQFQALLQGSGLKLIRR